MSLDEIGRVLDLQSRREHSIITKNHTNLDELMYDDYDLDYTFSNDHTYDLDEMYDAYMQSYALDAQALDSYDEDDYTRDALDYDALAYKHYA